MRKINKAVIHDSASLMEQTTWELIRKWHIERGFKDIGYHWGVDMHGELFKGRDESEIGAHCKGHNEDSLGIVLFGDFTKEKPTDSQLLTLYSLCDMIMRRHNLTPQEFYPHYKFSNTLCPGILGEYIENYREFGIF